MHSFRQTRRPIARDLTLASFLPSAAPSAKAGGAVSSAYADTPDRPAGQILAGRLHPSPTVVKPLLRGFVRHGGLCSQLPTEGIDWPGVAFALACVAIVGLTALHLWM